MEENAVVLSGWLVEADPAWLVDSCVVAWVTLILDVVLFQEIVISDINVLAVRFDWDVAVLIFTVGVVVAHDSVV